MKFRLPYSKNRRYLTGMDWTIQTLDRLVHSVTGRHYTFQVVLDLHGPFDFNRFKSSMEQFVQEFPELGGYAARDWTLAPYWKMPRSGDQIRVKVDLVQAAENQIASLLEQGVNDPLPETSPHLVFRVYRISKDRHRVAAQFDHQLFDAPGAEAFLDLFHHWSTGQDCQTRFAKLARTEPAHLSNWMRKFEAGKQLIRRLRGMTETALMILPRPVALKGRSLRFRVLEFDEQETASIVERADREAGFLMFMPYALASALQAVHPAFVRAKATGRDYLVSVSVDLRTPATAAAHLFFNHLSFLLFRIPTSQIGDRHQMLDSLRTQMYEQVKSGFPQALYESSMLMRILPTRLLGRLMLKPLRGEFASLGFTCVGKGYGATQFMEASVANLIHMPLVPVPPGLGLFVNQYGKKMNVILSYVDGLLTDEEARVVLEEARRLL